MEDQSIFWGGTDPRTSSGCALAESVFSVKKSVYDQALEEERMSCIHTISSLNINTVANFQHSKFHINHLTVYRYTHDRLAVETLV